MITWIVISNLLDIDFIHGDIHDRSCKNISDKHYDPLNDIHLLWINSCLKFIFFADMKMCLAIENQW